MTERVIRAVRHPRRRHPRARDRPPAAPPRRLRGRRRPRARGGGQEARTHVELNANRWRLDLDPQHHARAVALGLRVPICPRSLPADLDEVRWGVLRGAPRRPVSVGATCPTPATRTRSSGAASGDGSRRPHHEDLGAHRRPPPSQGVPRRRVRAGPRRPLQADRRDHPQRAVHRRDGQPGHAGAVRTLSRTGGPRAGRPEQP